MHLHCLSLLSTSMCAGWQWPGAAYYQMPTSWACTKRCHCAHRARAELEARMIKEETASRITDLIEHRVQEVMSSAAVQDSLNTRLEAERKTLEEQVAGQDA